MALGGFAIGAQHSAEREMSASACASAVAIICRTRNVTVNAHDETRQLLRVGFGGVN